MLNEIVTQSHVLLPGVEQSFGVLAAPHALAEILVNPNGAVEAGGSEWRLYDVTPAGAALVWRGGLTPPFQGTQRLTPSGGISAAGLYELRSVNLGAEPTTVAVTASLVGYDPECCAEPEPPLNEGRAVLILGNRDVGTTATTRFLVPGFDNTSIAPTTQRQFRLPRPGMLRNLMVHVEDPSPNPDMPRTLTATLQIAAVPGPAIDTALAVTWDRGDANAQNLVNSVAGARGDLISVALSKSGTISPGVMNILVTVELGP